MTGGGGGGADAGGGGGAGGIITGTGYPVGPGQLYTVQVGAGGAGSVGSGGAANGVSSFISGGNTVNAAFLTAAGGALRGFSGYDAIPSNCYAGICS